MFKPLALAAACLALTATSLSLASESADTSEAQIPQPNSLPVEATPEPTCTPAAELLRLSLWRTRRPLAGRVICPLQPEHLDRLRTRFHRYALYRRVATFPGPGSGPKSPSDGRWWAIPWYIVCGESRGQFHIPDGAYQIIPSTWQAAGGLKYAANAGDATANEQHQVAHDLWGHTAWYGSC